jgi:hypothetical protein
MLSANYFSVILTQLKCSLQIVVEASDIKVKKKFQLAGVSFVRSVR